MRSLLLLSASASSLPPSSSSSSSTSSSQRRITALSTDAATETLYAASESLTDDGQVLVELWKLEKQARGIHQEPTPMLNWSSLASLAPSSSASARPSSPPNDQIISLKYLPESDSLVCVLRNGDIEQIFSPSGEAGPASKENVGTFEEGIKAAEWSPDEELLAVVTGSNLLLSLTKSFEPLSETPLLSHTFGADAPVNVGWGSTGTQFHGSLGKEGAALAAAARAREEQQAQVEEGDERVRISWRGDSAWFAVSSLDPAPAVEGAGGGGGGERRRRVIRVFSRIAELSSTSESCPGLQGALSWQPSGSIIASTQLRPSSGDGKEKGGLYVVFFERNGLRRYDFPLREHEEEGTKVRQVQWNADSSVLAVWVTRGNGEDVVQLWHRNNYYWALKQSLTPSFTSSSMSSLFWDPEQALSLHLVTEGGVESYTLEWDVFASSRAPPLDDGAVAVIDGNTSN